ncbi:hypothetical protein HYPSUDRAFT_219402 [Hypholoma sublateritium FD-334 SS-4]|uniref:Peptidase C14 caspase domain-containing protein n=1 Tax=Hypholoma sublateritium (strain FD-334 SS-4) TaxID=945553 RepID=A0A0D2KPK2_HYPSF|nr:hypothetical protein HYPSUDRAFT_219402 [Hypholoma sublateritium FD-334 SS-4]
MSSPAADYGHTDSVEVAKYAFTSSEAVSGHAVDVEDTSLYLIDQTDECPLPITLPKRGWDRRMRGTAALARPFHLDLPQYADAIPLKRNVSTSSSTSSQLQSESGSSSSEDDTEFPLTPRDDLYSPTLESITVYSPDTSDENAELYFEPELRHFRRLVEYNLPVVNTKAYRQFHKHVSQKPSQQLSIPSWLSNTIGYRPQNLKQPYAEALTLMKKLWSSRKGRRKALCIGIDYKGQIGDALKGCVNDAHRMRDFLIEHGKYEAKDITTLSDGGGGECLPTRENIINAIRQLVDGARKEDILFFHYSGHGFQVPDQNGDEADGLDEVLVPVDYKRSGYILDDLLNEILVKNLPKGCHLTALIDACHSGTILDLPYNYHCDGPTDGLDICSKKAIDIVASVVSWSGCTDTQLSEEIVKEKGLYGGVMTDAFLSCLASEPRQTFQELYDNLMEKIHLTHIQKPQLGVSREIDATHLFVY